MGSSPELFAAAVDRQSTSPLLMCLGTRRVRAATRGGEAPQIYGRTKTQRSPLPVIKMRNMRWRADGKVVSGGVTIRRAGDYARLNAALMESPGILGIPLLKLHAFGFV